MLRLNLMLRMKCPPPQIPPDCEAVEGAVAGERALRAQQLRPPPSSFAEDAAAVLGPAATSCSPVSHWSGSSGAPAWRAQAARETLPLVIQAGTHQPSAQILVRARTLKAALGSGAAQ